MRVAGGSLGALALILAAPAVAREADAIVVTGTRIPAEEPALEPLVTYSGDRLDDRALTNLADGLNEQPG